MIKIDYTVEINSWGDGVRVIFSLPCFKIGSHKFFFNDDGEIESIKDYGDNNNFWFMTTFNPTFFNSRVMTLDLEIDYWAIKVQNEILSKYPEFVIDYLSLDLSTAKKAIKGFYGE